MVFSGSSTAGNATFITSGNGVISFSNVATSGSATFNGTGYIYFIGTSNAGSSIITGWGVTNFEDMTSASNSTINIYGGVQFSGTSTAANATLIINGGTAGFGGAAYFSSKSDGGTASATVNGNSVLDISGLTTTGMNIGSIAGSGTFALGGKTLTVGGNNLSTVVSGLIVDGGLSGGTGGSIIKTGTGTLTLNGTNTYTGTTKVNQGGLVVNGSIASSAGVTVSAGATLSGHGNVGVLSGGGLTAPGGSQIMTAKSVDLSGSMSFTFQLRQTGAPTYGSAASSGNDLLDLTSGSPLPGGALSAINTFNVDFTGDTLAPGQLYLGGFYTNAALNTAAVGTPSFNYTGVTDSYTIQYEGMVSSTARFSGQLPKNGNVMEFEVVPEPGTWGMVVLGAGLLVLFRRRVRA